MADGEYRRAADVNGRPSYRRMDHAGEAMRLLYSNAHGDWRIVAGVGLGWLKRLF